MISPDDAFRAYFQTVVPRAFPPCPAIPTESPITPAASSRPLSRPLWTANRTVLAIAASLFLVIAFSFAPSNSEVKSPDVQPSLLNQAMSNGQSLQLRTKTAKPIDKPSHHD
ncbi:MAG: hypothetical protein U0798_12195 [Gemmataceae bacterium]